MATHSNKYDLHWKLYPKTYVAHRAPYSFIDQLDGDLYKDVWTNVQWSDDFQDIQGSDAPDTAIPPAPTRFKALWDDNYLYIGALLEPSDRFNTQAHYRQRNSPIYQRDSDFEVFVDAAACNHDYKELEINALNTVWNLLLDKPYWDGGHEHSGRIAQPGQVDYYDVTKQRTATKIVHGRLNDATGKGATWSVELALSFRDLLQRYPSPIVYPAIGGRWRINFSRVELQGKVNWTWQPQTVWDATLQQFVGKVDMHLPDGWGYLVFGGPLDKAGTDSATNDESSTPRDPTWPARLAAMNVYYAQKQYLEQRECYSSSIDALNVRQAIVEPFDVEIDASDDGARFKAKVSTSDGTVVSIRQDRLLIVERGAQNIESS